MFFCSWWALNRGPLLWETTSLTTEPPWPVPLRNDEHGMNDLDGTGKNRCRGWDRVRSGLTRLPRRWRFRLHRGSICRSDTHLDELPLSSHSGRSCPVRLKYNFTWIDPKVRNSLKNSNHPISWKMRHNQSLCLSLSLFCFLLLILSVHSSPTQASC